MDLVEQILQCGMIRLKMSAKDGSANLEGVDSLGECVDAMTGYECFTKLAHGHEDNGHLLWRLLNSGMLRFRCTERCWCGSC